MNTTVIDLISFSQRSNDARFLEVYIAVSCICDRIALKYCTISIYSAVMRHKDLGRNENNYVVTGHKEVCRNRKNL